MNRNEPAATISSRPSRNVPPPRPASPASFTPVSASGGPGEVDVLGITVVDGVIVGVLDVDDEARGEVDVVGGVLDVDVGARVDVGDGEVALVVPDDDVTVVLVVPEDVVVVGGGASTTITKS